MFAPYSAPSVRMRLHYYKRYLANVCRRNSSRRLPYSALGGLSCLQDSGNFSGWCTNLRRNYSARVQNHYDLLGITPKASQIQVKSAYYRLSKKYHPDVNKSPDAAKLFAQISQAYEILGNAKNRRVYDQGFSNPTRSSVTYDDIDVRDIIRRDRKQPFGKRGPIPKGKTEHFDFDEFYRQHYGETLRMKKEGRAEKARNDQWIEDDRKRKKASIVVYTATVLAIAAYFWLG